jgi:hypothetical protein
MATSSIDPSENLVVGYPRLSGEMGLLPQLAIFRRFGALGARNLLYFQAELFMLEQRLCEIEKSDSLSNEGKKSSYRHNWSWMCSLDSVPPTEPCEQWQLMLKIRGLLKEYCIVLLNIRALK